MGSEAGRMGPPLPRECLKWDGAGLGCVGLSTCMGRVVGEGMFVLGPA